MPLQLFRRAGPWRPRPQEVCRRLAEDLNRLGPGIGVTVGGAAEPRDPGGGDTAKDRLRRSISEDVQKQLQALLEVLEDAADRGERGASLGGDHTAEIASEFLAQFLLADLPSRLIGSLGELEFEVRKDVISVFSAIVRMGAHLGADQQIQEYARRHPRFYELLVEGYDKPEIATHCGVMLRSCARHRHLVEVFLGQPQVVIRLLHFTRHESFDISSDAFSSLHDFLLTHKAISAMFLEANFHDFFAQYNGLLQSDDYVTQRQALKLLSEMLLDRTFMRVMLAYIGDDQFLQIHMNLLRADSKAIQLEAFHVFKIFVANPQKPPRVQYILYKNKEKLVKLLEKLRPNRPGDRQFAEDRTTVIGKLQVLEPPPKMTSVVAANTMEGVDVTEDGQGPGKEDGLAGSLGGACTADEER